MAGTTSLLGRAPPSSPSGATLWRCALCDVLLSRQLPGQPEEVLSIGIFCPPPCGYALCDGHAPDSGELPDHPCPIPEERDDDVVCLRALPRPPPSPLDAPALERLATGPVCRAWAWVDALSGRPTRRWLPGSHATNRPLPASHALFASVAAWLCDLASRGYPAAQVLAAFFPKLVLARGIPPLAQLQALLRDDLDAASSLRPRDQARSQQPSDGWLAALSRAAAAGTPRRIVALLDAPPPAAHATPDDALEWLPRLFPLQGMAADPPLPDSPNAADIPPLSEKELLRWLLDHRLSSPGSLGWAPRICLQMRAAFPDFLDALTRFWALRPCHYRDPRLASFVWRQADGWLLPGPLKPRPIAAPQISRRVHSARLARLARPAIAVFCEPRRQFGVSGGAHLAAYITSASLAVAAGATLITTGDRSMSYQTFRRDAVASAVANLLRGTFLPSGPRAALRELTESCWLDDRGRTQVSFSAYGAVSRLDGLAQGCSSSPLLEALTLAHSFRHEASLGAHDDIHTTLWPSQPSPIAPLPTPS